MGTINFADIYNQGIDLDELARYYEKKEEEKKREKMKGIATVRTAAATAIKKYFDALDPDNCITIEELNKNLENLELPYIHQSVERGFSAGSKDGKSWDVKFKGDFTKEEKQAILNRIKKMYT